jgi:two-component system sensor histidine kinase YesM
MANQNGSHLTITEKFSNRNDEIGILYNEYNVMVEELNASIKKDYQDKLITMDAQMRSLEAQINSHFLFNTLESINSLAELDDNERISTMVMALGNMFRYSIKTQSELVTIEEEIQHVQDYISIQQIRFDQRFTFQLFIPPDLYQLRVLKLILQPLVENALYHGLNYCSSGDTITLDGYLDHSFLHLCVTDNGIGMTAEELTLLQKKLQEESSFTELGHRTRQSIGLKNIHTRIELYYGKGYGITIKSAPHSGTAIDLLLPLLNSFTENGELNHV